ncbi:MAG: dut [Parachlamydiales bacterium]|nr:dut [Parachlamydiales bacterium]
MKKLKSRLQISLRRLNSMILALVRFFAKRHIPSGIGALQKIESNAKSANLGPNGDLQSALKVVLTAPDVDLIPVYGTPFSAGADVRANISENIVIFPGQSALIPTGLKMEVPAGFEIQIRPRSGLALRHQITVLNSPGTIDSDYRGEIGVILINHGREPFTVAPKMRMAQMVLAPVIQAQFTLQEEALSASERGEGGFGHTGTN